MDCPKCGAHNVESAEYCALCLSPFSQPQKLAGSCGAGAAGSGAQKPPEDIVGWLKDEQARSEGLGARLFRWITFRTPGGRSGVGAQVLALITVGVVLAGVAVGVVRSDFWTKAAKEPPEAPNVMEDPSFPDRVAEATLRSGVTRMMHIEHWAGVGAGVLNAKQEGLSKTRFCDTAPSRPDQRVVYVEAVRADYFRMSVWSPSGTAFVATYREALESGKKDGEGGSSPFGRTANKHEGQVTYSTQVRR